MNKSRSSVCSERLEISCNLLLLLRFKVSNFFKFLSYYMPTSFAELEECTERAVLNYNYNRPHDSLNNATPADIYGFSTKNSLINKEKKKQKKKFYNNNYIYNNN